MFRFKHVLVRKYFKTIAIIAGAILFKVSSFANQIDSLETALNLATSEYTKTEILSELGEARGVMRLSFWDSISQRAILSENLKIEAYSLNNLGYLNEESGNIPLAIEKYNESAHIYNQIQDTLGLLMVWTNLGYVYDNLGDIAQALKSFQYCLHLLETFRNDALKSTTINNLAYIYETQGDLVSAEQYYKQTLQLAKDNKHHQGIAMAYDHLGIIAGKKGKADKEMDYYLKSLAINRSIKDAPGLSISYANVGMTLLQQGQFDSALVFLQKSYDIEDSLQNKDGVSHAALNLSLLYLGRNSFKLAKYYGIEGYTISTELGYPLNISKGCSILYTINKRSENYRQALQYYEEFITMRDSISNESNAKAAIKQQMNYEYEKEKLEVQKEQEKKDALADAKLKQQQIVIYSSLGGLAVVLILAGFIFKARRESEKLLLNILPESTSKELKSKGKVEPKYYEQATVMFTDFKGFTMISEQMTPEALVTELDYVFKEFDRIIAKYPIEKIKTIGDAYMACGGIPEVNDTNALDVVKAALEIKSFMKEYATRRAQENLPYFEVRIGVHTGPLVAGVVGEKKFAYDIWGDTVNTASRMESSGEAGKVNISGDTYEFIVKSLELDEAQFKFTNRGKIQAKNKGEIEMWFVEL